MASKKTITSIYRDKTDGEFYSQRYRIDEFGVDFKSPMGARRELTICGGYTVPTLSTAVRKELFRAQRAMGVESKHGRPRRS